MRCAVMRCEVAQVVWEQAAWRDEEARRDAEGAAGAKRKTRTPHSDVGNKWRNHWETSMTVWPDKQKRRLTSLLMNWPSPPHNEIHMDRPIHISINICKAPLPSKQSAMTFPTARPSDVLQHFALLQFEEVAWASKGACPSGPSGFRNPNGLKPQYLTYQCFNGWSSMDFAPGTMVELMGGWW